MAHFNKIADSLLEEFNKMPVKEGYIYSRSETLKIWKERRIRIDENTKHLFIVSKKKEKDLKLSRYVIKWIG